jgi:hypothetical protein
VTYLIVAFRNFANGPKNRTFSWQTFFFISFFYPPPRADPHYGNVHCDWTDYYTVAAKRNPIVARVHRTIDFPLPLFQHLYYLQLSVAYVKKTPETSVVSESCHAVIREILARSNTSPILRQSGLARLRNPAPPNPLPPENNILFVSVYYDLFL